MKKEVISIEANQLLTFSEAIRYLRVSRSTLYRLMWAGKVIGHKVGSTWRFYQSDLQTVIRWVPLAREPDDERGKADDLLRKAEQHGSNNVLS